MGISCLHTRLSFDELMSQCDDQYLMSIAIISGNLELVHVDATSGMIGEIRNLGAGGPVECSPPTPSACSVIDVNSGQSHPF